jgi:CubicO group peptidase (beta-lactamase class C family)
MTHREPRCHASAKVLWIVAIALTTGCAHAPMAPARVSSGDHRSTIKYLSELIRYEMDRNSVTGLSIALVDDQRVVWAAGFGYADRDKGVAATEDTLYRVGSVSKLFTDTAVMQLAEQGRLDLDRPIADYVPEFTIPARFPGARPITPRNLMTHHSGLPRDLGSGILQGPQPLSEVLLRLKDNDPAYPPDLVFSYSNVGLSLLGLAVQDIFSIPFSEYMRASVLEPLGMSHSSFDPWPSTSPLMSRSYRRDRLAHETWSRDVPAGGLISSVADLSRFLEMVFAAGWSGGHRVQTSESLAEMLSPQNAATPLDLDFHIGLGWFLDRSSIPNAGLLAGHSGEFGQFHSQLSILPDHKVGVVVLANSGSSNVVGNIATETLKLALEVKTGIHATDPPEHARVEHAHRPWPAAAQQEYVGDYTTIFGLAHVYTRGGDLHVRVRGHDFDLVPRSDGKVSLEYVWLGLIHVNLGALGDAGLSRKVISGREVIVGTLNGKEILVGEQIKQLGEVGPWRRRLGVYRPVNLDGAEIVAKVQLSEGNGELYAEVFWADGAPLFGTTRMPFMPVSDDEAVQSGPLAGVGEVLRAVAVDGEERLRYQGFLFQGAP